MAEISVEDALRTIAAHRAGFQGTCVNERGELCSWSPKLNVDRYGNYRDQHDAHLASMLAGGANA